MKVLIVEDELRLRENLVASFKNAGYATEAAENGEDGLFTASEYPLDIAVVDIGLPGMSGLEMIAKLREQDNQLPVIVLTARDSWQDKVEGLSTGADDYMAKPFQFEELLARCNALLRRSAGFASPTIKFADIELDTMAQSVTKNGSVIDLTAYEYKVIEYLFLNPKKVVSKTELTEHIYEQDFDRDSNVLEVFVGRLRKKIDPDQNLKLIQTLRGQGYRLNPEYVS
ncbi:response regulator transcription factor [Aliikangiella coralliicola]|uniref:Response regulator transcription factor n=1 Tax=Aliikangiella coralliicola TaxID=2592383 RepID=A0A545U605_9GAMM|nr:response regulator transcription factor [Aliikangiella coralliicola]TQV84901.1 response regulator transcription factor [Aliikangiella coralliicola]